MRQASKPAGPAGVVPVLMYHDVSSRLGVGPLQPYVVHPAEFDEHLAAMADAGYRTAAATSLARIASPSESTVYLTFDDAYQSFHTTVLPALAVYGMRATVFAPSAFIGESAQWMRDSPDGDRRLMGWSELQEVVAAGSEVGSHGHRHLPLDLVSAATVRKEVYQSRQVLSDGLGRDVTSFAYPHGHNTAAVRRAARQAGYEVACAIFGDLQPLGGDLFAVRRVPVGPGLTGVELLALLRRRRSAVDLGLRALARPGWRAVRRVGARTRGMREA